MDDIYAIRRNNLRTLLSKRTGGNQSELARKLGMLETITHWVLTTIT